MTISPPSRPPQNTGPAGWRAARRSSGLPVCLAVYQAGDGRVAAQPVQGAAAVRADASDRDAEPGADLGVGHGWVGDEQSQQSLEGQRQAGERLAQRSVALGHEQLVLNRLGVTV